MSLLPEIIVCFWWICHNEDKFCSMLTFLSSFATWYWARYFQFILVGFSETIFLTISLSSSVIMIFQIKFANKWESILFTLSEKRHQSDICNITSLLYCIVLYMCRGSSHEAVLKTICAKIVFLSPLILKVLNS